MTLPKIKHVRAWFTGGATAEQGAGGGDYHDQGANHWIDDHIATPMSKYKQYEQSRQSFGINVLGTLIVEVEADNGQTGFAVSTAGEMGCFIVEKHLNRFIEGKCVSDIKLIHDQMLNATLYFKWIEECLPPQQYEGYRELKRQAPAGMMVTSGEHHGTLQSFRTLSETGIDIMQPDVGWCGGLTTLVEIAAIAKARGQLVVPHGSSVYSHHAVITFTNTPFSEFLMTSPDCATLRPQFDPILLGEPVPERGRIHKSVLDKPGFGVELNRDCNLKRPYQH